MAAKEGVSALDVAKEVYGQDSEEYRKAEVMRDAKWARQEKGAQKEKDEDEGRDLLVTISKDATFADLFKATDKLEVKEGFDDFHFDEELWDNFSPEIGNEVLAFRNHHNAEQAASTKVVDFFQGRGFSPDDITTFLPIKFRGERSKRSNG